MWDFFGCFCVTNSFLIVLETLAGLLQVARLLHALPLQVVFEKHLLKLAAVVPALAYQHAARQLLGHKYSP